MHRYGWFAPAAPEEHDPRSQAVLVDRTNEHAYILSKQNIPWANADAGAIIGECSAGMRDALRSWCDSNGVPLVDGQRLSTFNRVLLAGDLRGADVLKDVRLGKMGAVDLNTYSIQNGRFVVSLECDDERLARKVLGWMLEPRPLSADDVEWLRLRVAHSMPGPAAGVPGNLYCGDLHMHTVFSDGNTTPLALAMQAIYCGMDFNAITDHNRIDGAQLAVDLFGRYRVAHPLIVGEEVTNGLWHMNAYPLKEMVSADQPMEDAAAEARAQGAFTQYNHAGFPNEEWAEPFIQDGLMSYVDAWEHIPLRYDDWKAAGYLPLITGTTDTHDGTFTWPERTVVLADSPREADVMAALNNGQALMVQGGSRDYAYGDPRLVAAVKAALLDGKALRERKAELLKSTLKDADVGGLIQQMGSAKH